MRSRASRRRERETLLLQLRALANGSLRIDVRSVRPHEMLTIDPSLIELSFWRESGGIIRGTLRHKASGEVAYFQATEALEALARSLHLRLEDANARRERREA